MLRPYKHDRGTPVFPVLKIRDVHSCPYGLDCGQETARSAGKGKALQKLATAGQAISRRNSLTPVEFG